MPLGNGLKSCCSSCNRSSAPLLVEKCLRLLHGGWVGPRDFPSSFGASRNDSFVPSPAFVAFFARRGLGLPIQ